MSDEARERVLAALLEGHLERLKDGRGSAQDVGLWQELFRSCYDAGQASRDAEIDSWKDLWIKDKNGRAQAEASAEQLERELANIKAGRDAQKSAADAHYDELQRVKAELAAERERVKELEALDCVQREYLQQATEAKERAESKRCRDVIERVRRLCWTTWEGVPAQYTEVKSKDILAALSAAPPAELPAADHLPDCSWHFPPVCNLDCASRQRYPEVFGAAPLPSVINGPPMTRNQYLAAAKRISPDPRSEDDADPSRQRIDKLGLEIERGQEHERMTEAERALCTIVARKGNPWVAGYPVWSVLADAANAVRDERRNKPDPATPTELERLRAALGEEQKRSRDLFSAIQEGRLLVEQLMAKGRPQSLLDRAEAWQKRTLGL